ncbi:uncharacterized protein EDB93DRAFT_1107808 [Suillus bovinus]|uniref:uncharacterized protein n=1 Tax=Suillus bovinus TaxID=48563 RepID=UPI001B87B45E|nr:uncharacterized protein EDB93DRAFT_1107808 [Suillus bovinus]KAG2132731.1 hypothetical protein EDB93DRAFT_1107808 [Suillus bovinus]
MSSNLLDWKSSTYNRSPTVGGFEECKVLFPCPEYLQSIAGYDHHWNSALLSLVTHGFHNDDGHLEQNKGFHPLTSEHYLTGFSKSQMDTEEQRLNNWWARAIHAEPFLPLNCGSTIVLHHPGATPPSLDISPENLKAEVYINPKVLLEHCELHLVVAQISQLFIADYATPLAQAFAQNRIRNNWKGSGPVSQTPSKGKTTLKGKQVEIVPLIPSPVSPSSAHFTFYGRPRGSLEGLTTSNSNILSYMPSYDSRIMWKPTQIRLLHTRESKGYHVRKEGPSRRAVVSAQDHSACQPMTPAVFNQSSSSSQAERCYPPSNSDNKCYPPSTSDQAWRHYPPTTPTRSKSTSFELPTPTSITARSPSDSRHYSVLALVPFGNETEVVLEELGYPDHFHWVCISIGKDYLLKRWFLKLQEVAEILEEHVEAIANAMLTDSQPVTSFPVRITVMVLPGTARLHNPRWLAPRTRTPYVKVLKEAKATDLASKFKQPRRRYLKKLSLGSVVHHRKRNKTSAWHAYMHFKGIQDNANKSFSEKSNIANLAKDETEYHQLTTEEKAQLIIDFDKVKKSSRDRPPNITTRSRAAECSRSFQLVREELEALKECVGVEAFIVMVHGVSDFTMVPKAFFTSPAAEHFVCLYLRKDIAQLATNFESTILANGLVMSKVTNNPSAVMEFKCYNDLVQRYHVKLVGWNHPKWANPSDLKSGIESLENVVLVIQANTCKFVKITPQEAKERQCHINDGEILTPDLKPPMPSDLPAPDSTQSSMTNVWTSLPPPSSDIPTPHSTQSPTANTRTSMPPPSSVFESEQSADYDITPAPMTPTAASSEPYMHPSSITNEMVDPILHALDHAASNNGPPIVQLPPTPPMPTPLPMPNEAPVLVTATNSKQTADGPPAGTLRSKCAWKLTEKGQSELESRNHTWCRATKKGTRRSKKSSAHVESDNENI